MRTASIIAIIASIITVPLAVMAVTRLLKRAFVVEVAPTGRDVCEGHAYDEGQCKERKFCCTWNNSSGTCESAVGEKPCYYDGKGMLRSWFQSARDKFRKWWGHVRRRYDAFRGRSPPAQDSSSRRRAPSAPGPSTPGPQSQGDTGAEEAAAAASAQQETADGVTTTLSPEEEEKKKKTRMEEALKDPAVQEALKDPETRKKIEEVQKMMENPEMKKKMELAESAMQTKEMKEKMAELREDPELKPIFEEMEKGGLTAVWKHSRDPEFMKKIDERIGKPLAKAMEEAAAKKAGGATVQATAAPSEESSPKIPALDLSQTSSVPVSIPAAFLVSFLMGIGVTFTLLFFRRSASTACEEGLLATYH